MCCCVNLCGRHVVSTHVSASALETRTSSPSARYRIRLRLLRSHSNTTRTLDTLQTVSGDFTESAQCVRGYAGSLTFQKPYLRSNVLQKMPYVVNKGRII